MFTYSIVLPTYLFVHTALEQEETHDKKRRRIATDRYIDASVHRKWNVGDQFWLKTGPYEGKIVKDKGEGSTCECV